MLSCTVAKRCSLNKYGKNKIGPILVAGSMQTDLYVEEVVAWWWWIMAWKRRGELLKI